MRRLSSVVGVAMFAACVVGCGEQRVGYGNTVAAYDTYGYAVDATGTRTDGPRYLRRTTAEVPDTDSPEEQLMLAVTVLLDEGGPASPGTTTYWEGICAPGHRPEGVEIRSDLVVVRLAGAVPGHRKCAMTASEREVQRQQLAWTVRNNLDPFAEEEPPLVRVVEADGDTWEAVADVSFIPPNQRPTN